MKAERASRLRAQWAKEAELRELEARDAKHKSRRHAAEARAAADAAADAKRAVAALRRALLDRDRDQQQPPLPPDAED